MPSLTKSLQKLEDPTVLLHHCRHSMFQKVADMAYTMLDQYNILSMISSPLIVKVCVCLCGWKITHQGNADKLESHQCKVSNDFHLPQHVSILATFLIYTSIQHKSICDSVYFRRIYWCPAIMLHLSWTIEFCFWFQFSYFTSIN